MGLGKRSKRRELPSRLRSSLLSLSLVLILTVFGIGLFKICTDKQANFENKIAELEQVRAEFAALNVHNARMRDRVEFLRTNEGVEEIAREKLGLVRPGELAYSVIPPPPPKFSESDEQTQRQIAHQLAQIQDQPQGVVVRVLRHLFSEKHQFLVQLEEYSGV